MKRGLAFMVIVAAGLSVAAAQTGDEIRRYMEDGRRIAEMFVQQLGGELRREMDLSGPQRALIVCKFGAPEIASSLSRRTGWRVSRVSLQTRNPALGQPDAWEHRVLKEFDKRVARGEKADAMEYGEVVSETGGQYFRYMKALPVGRLCLNCHGPLESLSPEVKERLATDYPHDRGTGYSLGQVRGAVTVKRPL